MKLTGKERAMSMLIFPSSYSVTLLFLVKPGLGMPESRAPPPPPPIAKPLLFPPYNLPVALPGRGILVVIPRALPAPELPIFFYPVRGLSIPRIGSSNSISPWFT